MVAVLRHGAQSRRDMTRRTRPTRTAMSGLSSGPFIWGGEAGRFLGGGDGERCLKKVKMVPFVFFFFFFWVDSCSDMTGALSTGISSSVAGGEERDESESAMFAVPIVVVAIEVAGRKREQRMEQG